MQLIVCLDDITLRVKTERSQDNNKCSRRHMELKVYKEKYQFHDIIAKNIFELIS